MVHVIPFESRVHEYFSSGQFKKNYDYHLHLGRVTFQLRATQSKWWLRTFVFANEPIYIVTWCIVYLLWTVIYAGAISAGLTWRPRGVRQRLVDVSPAPLPGRSFVASCPDVPSFIPCKPDWRTRKNSAHCQTWVLLNDWQHVVVYLSRLHSNQVAAAGIAGVPGPLPRFLHWHELVARRHLPDILII